jgi:hypothetical protein
MEPLWSTTSQSVPPEEPVRFQRTLSPASSTNANTTSKMRRPVRTATYRVDATRRWAR